jgi:hypothetical protein
VVVTGAAMSGLVAIASANQPVQLCCAPKTTEIRVFLNQFSDTHGNWRGLGNLIESWLELNLIGDISSPEATSQPRAVRFG